MITFKVIVIFLCAYLTGCYQYYVSSNEYPVVNGSCTFMVELFIPCGYLEDAARVFNSNSFQASMIHIILLPVSYSITEDLSFRFSSKNVINFHTLENLTRAKIFCQDGNLSMNFLNVSRVSVDSMEFYHCGKYKPVITVEDVNKEVYINNILFIRSLYGFIKTSGAINKLTILNCLFDGSTRNYAVNIGSQSWNATFSNLTFNNCSNGSLCLLSHYAAASNTSITIVNCSFVDNKAKNPAEGAGVTIYSTVSVNIWNCWFLNNSGSSAIFIEHRCSCSIFINYSKFINNTAGALAATSISKLLIFNSHFDSNSVAQIGGAIKINRSCANVEAIICPIITDMTINSSNFTNNKAMGNGGALAVVTVQSYWRVVNVKFNIQIIHSVFCQNSGENGGALYLIEIHNLTITHSSFWCNYVYSSSNNNEKGGAVFFRVYQKNPSEMFVYNNYFINNTAKLGGSLYFYTTKRPIKNPMMIANCSFTSNKATSFGGALHISQYEFNLNDTLLSLNEAARGGAVYLEDAKLNITRAIFKINRACTGGAIYSSQSVIFLHDINLDGNKAMQMNENISRVTSMERINNFVCIKCNDTLSGKGGGIFIQDQVENCELNSSCPIVWNYNSSIKHANNLAEAGSLLYGGMITRCSTINQNIAIIPLNSTLNNAIGSKAINFCFAYNAFSQNCDSRKLKKTVYLGQPFEISVACLDQVMKPKKCEIKSEYDLSSRIHLDVGERSHVIESYETLTFHAYSQTENYADLIMTSNIICTLKKFNTLRVHVQIEECPTGFEKKNAICQCDRRLVESFETVKCNIDNISFAINEKGWFGYDDKFLRVVNVCPVSYCSPTQEPSSVTYPHITCADNRRGILCGKCLDNYSIVIGSSKCKNCSGSYNFSWLNVLLALAGMALVLFLLLVKMTVSSGTSNGLILYANILSVSGILDLRNCFIHPILRVFLSWINLDLGIEMCYYSGMDVYQKTWLQFIFPFYIWFLVGVIILFCHYSSRVMKLMGMRNIEVLATLFLLSYAKLLKTIITALSFTNLNVASAGNLSDTFILNRVWLYDAHIEYFNPKHLPLFTMAVVFLVCLFVPYTFLLLFGQCITSIPKRKGLHWVHSPILSTILDAYFAPYRKNTRFWTGLCLLLRCTLFTLCGTSYSINNNLFWIIVSVVLLLLFRSCCGGFIYQKKAVDIIESIFIVNLGAVALILRHKEEWCGIITASACLSLALFIGLVFFHIFLELKKYTSWPNRFQQFFQNLICDNSLQETEGDCNTSDKRESHSVTYVELREPLIGN